MPQRSTTTGSGGGCWIIWGFGPGTRTELPIRCFGVLATTHVCLPFDGLVTASPQCFSLGGPRGGLGNERSLDKGTGGQRVRTVSPRTSRL